MRIIKKLSEMIDEEIDDAMKYARCAANSADQYPDLSRLWADLSEQELRHMERLHDAVVEIIQRIHKEGAEIPAGMEEMYQYLHERAVGKAVEVKLMLQEIRG